MPGSRPWLVCQIGAREHYVLARELHRRGQLGALITDAWARPGSLAARLPGLLGRRLAERYSPDLERAEVVGFTGALFQFELLQRLRGATGWDLMLARNRWFGAQTARALARSNLLSARPVVFAYSYGARDVLEAARAAGCTTVLGQIDPAVAEEELVADAVRRNANLSPTWEPAPHLYWRRWREECALADRIIVNSCWARDGLLRAGIAADKLRVVPLAYDASASPLRRDWPPSFDAARPLRVLFLGSFILRKGAAELLEAAQLLHGAPVEFHIVGGTDLNLAEPLQANTRLRFHGAVPRHRVHAHYAAADVFILPTLSDGFGLTQLEALGHGLPVIASRHCGEVVRDGVDGFLLHEVTGHEIASAIRKYCADPALLSQHSAAARSGLERFRVMTIGDQLLRAVGGT